MVGRMKRKSMQTDALLKLNPCRLLNASRVTEDGLVVMDKNKVVVSKEDAALLCVLLNCAYKWDYKGKYEDITVYFVMTGDCLEAGVYDMSTGEKRTRVKIASPRNSEIGTIYTYTAEDFEKIKKKYESILTVV